MDAKELDNGQAAWDTMKNEELENGRKETTLLGVCYRFADTPYIRIDLHKNLASPRDRRESTPLTI